MDTLIGARRFNDGTLRPVYLDHEGRQYVNDDGGCPVFGDWLWRGDEGTEFGDWCDVPLSVGSAEE